MAQLGLYINIIYDERDPDNGSTLSTRRFVKRVSNWRSIISKNNRNHQPEGRKNRDKIAGASRQTLIAEIFDSTSLIRNSNPRLITTEYIIRNGR